jgi:DNA-binding HxlR family transcriptional regulator
MICASIFTGEAIMADAKNLQVSMAGSGNPYGVLNKRRMQLIHALHTGQTLTDIQTMLQITPETLQDDLTTLAEASLLIKTGDTYKPGFLVADKDETRRVVRHAMSTGNKMYGQLRQNWQQ